MDGIHDLGGMDGFGLVRVEPDEPVFHAPWEGRVLAMLFALGPAHVAGGDAYRHSVERMEPAHYLAASYYERMLTGVASLLVERGVVTREQLELRAGGGFPLARPEAAFERPPASPPTAEPRFGLGDRVLVRNMHPRGHTRCPRYVRGKRGLVVRVDPSFTLPDVAAHAADAPRETTYGVRFSAEELWGEAGTGEQIHVDLWESYLLPA